MRVSRPLPGIRFEPQPKPLGDVLPRMDIPLFAGFVSCGPLHRPVPVEDAGQFADIFGGDVELPRPRGAHDPRGANLAPAVRAFFRNGGRRCWVVRVAAEVDSNRFRLRGLFTLNGGTVVQAEAVARAQGSWSDGLRVFTSLVADPLRFAAIDPAAGRIDVNAASQDEVQRGDVVRASWLGLDARLFVAVTSVARIGGTTLRIVGDAHWFDGNGNVLNVAPAVSGTPAIDRLTFDLIVRRPGGPSFTMEGLGFTPVHPRYFGALPSDARLYDDASQFTDGATTVPLPALWRDALTPRFPLAAKLDGATYIPVTMPSFFTEDDAELAQLPSNASSLDRDGLAALTRDLFLDSRLADAEVRDLLDYADALRYVEIPPHALRGIHAVIGIDEVTMIAAPDAMHRGWELDQGVAMAWPPSSPLSSPIASPPARPAGCDGAPRDFFDCGEPIEVPQLSASDPASGWFELAWMPAKGSIDEIEEAFRPDFEDATLISSGAAGRLSIYGRPPGTYFYRIRRLRGGRSSEWSFGTAVHMTTLGGWTALDDAGDDDPLLRGIHAGMVRLAAARGDLTAILSLPRHYDARAAIGHANAVSSALGDESIRSYGAIWHPWLIGRDDDGALRETPPDGAAAGVMAARANARGAWVAPANVVLRDVVALTPAIPREALQSLQDAAINLIRQEPGGFLCLDADTLSNDADVRPLNVRRLLILVRRAALRAGNDYVFEPNGGTLRTIVRRGFQSMLESFFRRGAFAGRTSSSAFQVVTDETVNTPQGIDQGRLVAELKVAPSRPLSFLTIRLVQRGESTVAQEVR